MSAITVPDELLAEAKNFLDITWTDEDSDRKLMGQIKRGIAFISAKTGVDTSAYAEDYRAQALLFNYLLYDRAGSVDQFETNYRSEIIALHRRWEVEQYAAKAEG